MKIAFYSTKNYDREFFDAANKGLGYEITYLESRLNAYSAKLAEGYPVICTFVNDDLSCEVVRQLHEGGTRFFALRCAGFNNVDMKCAAESGIKIGRVPAYSPHSVAEHTVGMILTLSRKIHRAYNRTREGNFALDGLMGFDLYGKTAGIIGTGKIGAIVAQILQAFGCRVLANDQYENENLKKQGVRYTDRCTLFGESDVVSLHCPLTAETRHLVGEETLGCAKPGVLLVNTSRGGLVDTEAVIRRLKTGRIGALGLDVYEEEANYFFEDYSEKLIQDDVFARLLTFPNVLITGHQAFFTREAVQAIAKTTLENITAFEKGETIPGEISWEMVRPK